MNDMFFNIVIDADESFLLPLITMLKSLFKNSPKDYTFRLFFLYYDDNSLSEKSTKKLKSIMDTKHLLYMINIPSRLSSLFDTGRWNKQVLLKLYAPYYLPSEVHKFIHIDGDVIVRHDISPFYDSDVSQYVLFGVNEQLTWPQHLEDKYGIKDGIYLNCGCVVFNKDYFLNVFPTIESLFSRINSINYQVNDSEQGFLNIIFDGLKGSMPNKEYMFFTKYNSLSSEKTIAVYHYAGNPKPWNYNYDSFRFSVLFWKYGYRQYGMISALLHIASAFYLNVKNKLLRR